jgi:hypothetical protein
MLKQDAILSLEAICICLSSNQLVEGKDRDADKQAQDEIEQFVSRSIVPAEPGSAEGDGSFMLSRPLRDTHV